MKNIFRKSALIVLAAAAMTGCIKVIEPQEGTADVNQVGSAPNAIQNYVDAVTRSICGKLYFGSSYAHDLGLPGMMLARDVTGQDIVLENSGTEWFSTWYQVRVWARSIWYASCLGHITMHGLTTATVCFRSRVKIPPMPIFVQAPV